MLHGRVGAEEPAKLRVVDAPVHVDNAQGIDMLMAGKPPVGEQRCQAGLTEALLDTAPGGGSALAGGVKAQLVHDPAGAVGDQVDA